MRRLLQLLNRDYRQAAQMAKKCVKRFLPDANVHHVTLRADEPERWVVAVFYTTPKLMVKPTPYRIVAVSKATKIAEGLSHSPDSPYWIRGRK